MMESPVRRTGAGGGRPVGAGIMNRVLYGGIKGKPYGAINLPPTLRKVREGWGNHGTVMSAC